MSGSNGSRPNRNGSGGNGSAADFAREDALLDAGAVARVGTELGERRDTLTARVYGHAALDGRSVVRLTTAMLGQAEDLTLGFLGFAEPSAATEVGVVRQQALGFPAWALVHDPANGHHALALVKDIEKISRRAKSKPGNAKDGFETLASRLAAAVPHFLPTYYEQAARAFLAAENTTYATSFFTRARVAEQEYGLKIDEDAQAASFLEFALAGALSAKSLTAYGKGLAARCTPEEAYARFRRICVERVAGGLPPYTNMPKDLKRLAKTANLDTAEEDAAVARELLPLSATGKAGVGFWKAYRPALVRAGAADERVRGLLIGMLTTMGNEKANVADALWLELLDSTGAARGLTSPLEELSAQEVPPGGASAWLMRFARHANRGYQTWTYQHPGTPPARGILPLVERMAERLRAEDVELDLCAWKNTDTELIDLCLALGLRVADPGKDFDIDLGQWLAQPYERDLSDVASDLRFRPYLAKEVARLASDHQRASESRNSKQNGTLHNSADRAVSAAGVRGIVSDWLADLAQRTAAAGLADLVPLLDLWLHNSIPSILATNPEAAESVLGLDVAPRLAHALRAGIFDEYGWPVLERACERLVAINPENKHAWTMTSQWPYAILWRDGHAEVLSADSKVLEHQVSVPQSNRIRASEVRFTQGQLLVAWYGWQQSGLYWSGDPLRVFEPPHGYYGSQQEDSLELPWGGRTFGGEPLTVGSADWGSEAGARVASDGTRYWVYARQQEVKGRPFDWHEFDPRTGKRGGLSVPAFFEQGAEDGSTLDRGASWLITADPARAHSPLGQADGLLGGRLRARADGTQIFTGIDGREQIIAPSVYSWSSSVVQALIDVPGSDRRQAVAVGSRLHLVDDGVRRTAELVPGERFPTYARGTACVPPLRFWHFLSVRDEGGSSALRQLTDSQAVALLESAGQAEHEAAVATVAELMPVVTDAGLRAGIAGYATVAGSCQTRIGKLRVQFEAIDSAGRGSSDGESEGPTLSWTQEFQRAWMGLSGGAAGAFSTFDIDTLAALRILARSLTSEPSKADTKKLGEIHYRLWSELAEIVLYLPAIAMRAVSPAFDEKQRSTLLTFFTELDRTGLAASGSALRRLEITADDSTLNPDHGHSFATENGRVLILESTYAPFRGARHRVAWQYSRTGEFGAIPGWTILTEERGLAWPYAESIGGFAEKARDRGAYAVRPEAVVQLSELTGMSALQAAVLLAALPTLAYAKQEGTTAAMEAVLGAKPAAIKAAGARFDSMGGVVAPTRLVSGLLPKSMDDLWDSGPSLDKLVDRWVNFFGHQDPLPEWLRELSEKESSVAIVQALLNEPPASGPNSEDPILLSALPAAVYGLIWLAYVLPVGDPLRGRLPRALARLQQGIASPSFKLHVLHMPAQGFDDLARTLGYSVRTPGEQRIAGPLAHAVGSHGNGNVWLFPSLLSGRDDPALMYLCGACWREDLIAVRVLLDSGLDELVGVSDADKVAASESYFEQDPTRSVPSLVSEVAAKHGVSEDAAAIYLMLLALPDPNDREQARWLGWKPARLKAARAELAATDLVISGTRTRAGRTLFLPGPWFAPDSPLPPMEKWKRQGLGVAEDGRILIGRPLPSVRVSELYRSSWQRIVDGDVPRYDEYSAGNRR